MHSAIYMSKRTGHGHASACCETAHCTRAGAVAGGACRHVDVSSQRGNEEEIGEALSEVFSDWLVNRPDVWVTGKHWPEGSECSSPGEIKEQLKQTLQALRLEYLDLYLLPSHKNEKAFKVGATIIMLQ